MSDQEPVTIILSFRERWRHTPRTIHSIMTNTSGNFEVWLLDSGMPDNIRAEVEHFLSSGRFKIIDVGSNVWPNHARAAVAPLITSTYAVFIDNDVLVAPKWLENLVACADETGAGIVGPLYLWGSDDGSDLIHMAGGDLTIEEENAQSVMMENHRHCNARLSDVQAELVRSQCGYAEYHCMLMRREVFSATAVFDPQIVCVHEHIHASLVAKELGFETWLEPSSKVTYLAFSEWRLDEIQPFRQRWRMSAGETSIQRFAEKWNVIDDARSMGGVRQFLRSHTERVDPLHPLAHASGKQVEIMDRSDLQQTFGGLVLLMEERGYSSAEIRSVSEGYQLGLRLTNGIFRPCGRPFINHLTGTASVLVNFGFTLKIILAGLLHAAFSHGPSPRSAEADRGIADSFCVLKPYDSATVKLAKRYDARQAIYEEFIGLGVDPAQAPIETAEILILEAANEIDMHLSLEVWVSGRSDAIADDVLHLVQDTAKAIGVPALASTLIEARKYVQGLPKPTVQTGIKSSFFQTHDGIASAVRR